MPAHWLLLWVQLCAKTCTFSDEEDQSLLSLNPVAAVGAGLR